MVTPPTTLATAATARAPVPARPDRRAAATRPRHPLRLRTVLLVPFLIPMLASTALVVWLAVHDGRSVVAGTPAGAAADGAAAAHADARWTALLCLAAFSVAAAVGVLTSRWIGGQIRRLAAAAGGIAAGDFDRRVEARGVAEVEALAGSFNSMAAQLKESFTALAATNDTLRIAEENYRDIIENCVEGIFQSTLEGTYMSVNPAMARLHGYASADDMLAAVTRIADQVYVDPADRHTFERLMAEHGVVRGFEYRAYRQDRTVIWVEESTRGVRDNVGGVLYYEGMIHDVTDRKRQEQDLMRKLAELRVEIDHQKRQVEVEKITQSDYFQDLRAAAADLRQDDW